MSEINVLDGKKHRIPYECQILLFDTFESRKRINLCAVFFLTVNESLVHVLNYSIAKYG